MKSEKKNIDSAGEPRTSVRQERYLLAVYETAALTTELSRLVILYSFTNILTLTGVIEVE